jgi:hypothetical protein
MITRPTVFVLGAGASMPYGFPSGDELLNQVRTNLITARVGNDDPANSDLRRTLRLTGFPDPLVQQFQRALAETRIESIDDFLVRRPVFRDVGKAAIAATLIPYEEDAHLDQPRDADDDWYQYVYNRIIGRTVDEFRSNKLSVVTFNFDRSFERALFRTLKREHELSPERAADACAAIRVVHIHGELGAPAWLQPSAPAARDYRPRPPEADSWPRLAQPDSAIHPEDIRSCVRSIRLFDDECAEDTLEDANELLSRAERVAFLGFGFHPENVRKLACNNWDWWPKLANDRQGTAFRLLDGEIAGAKSRFPKGLQLRPEKCKQFLRMTDFIHG